MFSLKPKYNIFVYALENILHFKTQLLHLEMDFQVAPLVFDPYNHLPSSRNRAAHLRLLCDTCVHSYTTRVCDYFVHASYICDTFGAHDVCFTIQLRATSTLRFTALHYISAYYVYATLHQLVTR